MSWIQRYWLRSGCILALLGLACLVLPIFTSPALAATPAKKPAPKTPADKKTADEAHKHALDKLKAENLDIFKTPGEFIVSLAKDHQGNIWVGTEDLGVFRFSPNAEANQQWRQFTIKDGLGDDNGYAIACDKLGRVWVGQLNHGVAVYNGDKWRVYDVLDGPLGERIFSIATCPVDGDVWMATSAGLTRYSLKDDAWSYYTRAEGLPSDQANSLAFDKSGNLYVGTQCDGLAISSRASQYKAWRIVAAPERFGPQKNWPVPLNPNGNGLPSNLVNKVLVAQNGTIWVGTTTGLAYSSDGGFGWRYIRGRDYAGKVKGLICGAPKDWKPASADIVNTLLPEDYVTCIAEDDSNQIWLGFRNSGYLVTDSQIKKRSYGTTDSVGLNDNYIKEILPSTNGGILVGSYLGGLVMVKAGKAGAPASHPTEERSSIIVKAVSLPSPAKSPTLTELKQMLADLGNTPTIIDDMNPLVLALPDDWRTQGDWLGRYGRFWICLGAIRSPNDYVWGAGWEKVGFFAQIGPNSSKNDSIRRWIHWQYTTDSRTLELPQPYLHSRVLKSLTNWDVCRRQAEWDDHGEAYAQTKDGPDLFLNLRIPSGLYYLSLYDFNKDGHEKKNRFRDYRVSIRKHSSDFLYCYNDFDKQEELAKGRIDNFSGGVYKRYLVKGPTRLTIQIKRNYSLNTILAGVMIDLIDEYPPPYYQTVVAWKNKQRERHDGISVTALTVESDDDTANNIYNILSTLQYQNTAWWSKHSRKYYLSLLRYYGRKMTDPNNKNTNIINKLAGCYYQLNIFSKWEFCQKSLGKTTSREIEKALRWDGNIPSCQNKGYEIVSKFLSQ